jgi:hypothetical protein
MQQKQSHQKIFQIEVDITPLDMGNYRYFGVKNNPTTTPLFAKDFASRKRS